MIFDDDGKPIFTDDDMAWDAPVVEEERERAITVLEPNHRIDLVDLGTSPKRIFKAATALGWDVRAWCSITRVAPVLFVHGSTQDAKNPHAAGDVRYEGFDARNYAIEAKHPQGSLGFRAHWQGTSKDKSPTSAGFLYALVRDPVGVPVENWADYSPTALKQAKDEPYSAFQGRVRQAEEVAARRDRRYNDASSRLEKIHRFTQAGPFDLWLDDWLEMAGLELISRKKPATKAEKNQIALTEGGEWNG